MTNFLPTWLPTNTGPAGPTGTVGPTGPTGAPGATGATGGQASGGIVRFLEWRGTIAATLSPTLAQWLTTVDGLSESGRSTFTIREPGYTGFVRELLVYRYPPLGTPIPSPGPSGQMSPAGQFVYSVERNGVIQATCIVPTMIAQRSFSLGFSGAATDQISVRVSTPSGTLWSAQTNYAAVIRYSDT